MLHPRRLLDRQLPGVWLVSAEPTHSKHGFAPSDAARKASDYFNALPQEEREKLAPLLEHYRQMGLAEAHVTVDAATRQIDVRIRRIRDA
jgi:hypothetical protein